jgi:hypothetical protein
VCGARARLCGGNFEDWWIWVTWATNGFVLARYLFCGEDGCEVWRLCKKSLNCECSQKDVFGSKKLVYQGFTRNYYIICLYRIPV